MKTTEVLEKVLRGKRVKPETQRHYRDALGSLGKFSEDWPESGFVINEWLGSLQGYADMTVRNWFSYVNSAGKYMKKAYKVHNPCEDAERPRVERKRRRYFNAEELTKIIKACRYEQDGVLVLVLIDSACRIGELAGLQEKNVGDSWLDLKGKSGERRYRCDPRLCVKLRELGADGEPIFRNRLGGPASVSSLKHRVRRVVREAGITGSKLGPHTLRHSGASLVAQVTGEALVVKALLQHDKIETSMQYIHDAEGVIQQRVSPLALIGSEVFGGVGEVKQLEMGSNGEDNGVVVVEGEVVGDVVDLVEEMFPEIRDGVEVRSVFKTDELRLMRRAFVGYVRSGYANGDGAKLRFLLTRMLRKAKE